MDELPAGMTTKQLAAWRVAHWSPERLADELRKAEEQIDRMIAERVRQRRESTALISQLARLLDLGG